VVSPALPSNRLGLLAGAGRLPVLVARAAAGRGFAVYAFGFKDLMDPELAEHCAAFFDFPFCRLGAMFDRIETEGVKRAVTIGGIAQTSVISGMPSFDDFALDLWRKLPDRRVDTIMEMLIADLARRGIEVLSAVDFLTDHLAPAGALTERKPSDKEWEDIHFGWDMARAIGRLDIGQTVVVKHRAVMAVEAVEGTDRAILRGGELAKGGAVVVKVAKPGQDMRYDVPAVGRETLENMRRAGAGVLALEAGKVLIVEKEAMRTWADEAGICLVGVRPEEWAEHGR
jgi:UDP-2,3-diacylglucosamine hydrolase